MKKTILQMIAGMYLLLTGILVADKIDCNNGESCYEKARVFSKEGNKKAYKLYKEKSYFFYKKECDSGNGSSCGSYSFSLDYDDYEERLKYQKKGCLLGNSSSCVSAGETAVEIDKIDIAIKMLEKGCIFESPESCSELGDLYLNGDKIKKDLVKAQKYLTASCKIYNDEDICKKVASLEKKGIKLKEDLSYMELDCKTGQECMKKYYSDTSNKGYKKKAIFIYKSKCDFGDLKSCWIAGESIDEYHFTSLKKGVAMKAKYYFKGCQGGDSTSCHLAGNLYILHGDEGDENFLSLAITYYDEGCNLKNYNSCMSLGKIYSDGKLLEKNSYLANKYYYMGCDSTDGDEEACNAINYNLNAMNILKEGLALEESGNSIKAKEYYSKSCEMGESSGCLKMATIFLEKDLTESISYFEKACEKYNATGCEYAFEFNYKTKNISKASEYLSRVCDLVDEEKCNELKGFE